MGQLRGPGPVLGSFRQGVTLRLHSCRTFIFHSLNPSLFLTFDLNSSLAAVRYIQTVTANYSCFLVWITRQKVSFDLIWPLGYFEARLI